MRSKLRICALIVPLVVAFLVLLSLLSAAVVGEHRYACAHPSYFRHFCRQLLGEEENTEIGSFFSPRDVASSAQAEEPIHILVLGRDRAAGLTDVMMLVSLDAQEQSLSLLQIPRDTYMAYTTGSYKKCNGAYAKLGGSGLVSYLSSNMGIPIDHYVCVDLSVLAEMVDAIGGVPLTVPADMDYDDPAQNLHIHLKAGEQVLNGAQAQMFVRFRSGYALADVGRMDAQKVFLSALARQIQQNLSTAQLLEMVGRSFGKVQTDMGLRDCIACVKALREVKLSSMHMATLPGATARTNGEGGAWYYILNRAATEQVLSDTMGAMGTFDPSGVFTNAAKSSFEAIYRADAAQYRINDYTAEDALDGNVHIQRLS